MSQSGRITQYDRDQYNRQVAQQYQPRSGASGLLAAMFAVPLVVVGAGVIMWGFVMTSTATASLPKLAVHVYRLVRLLALG